MKLPNKRDLFFLIPIVSIYFILTIISANSCYFWDNIQQISKEAHWYYLTDFKSLLMPAFNTGSEIVGTGYHPPLMGIMTAALWKVFGYELWVSHVFVFLWALILIYNVWKLINMFIPEKFSGWVLFIVFLEPTILTQFSIASPDFILFTAFIITLRAIIERKQFLLAIGVFFLCCISMRGIFVGAILFVVDNYYSYLQLNKKVTFSTFLKTILPYLPTLLLLTAYYIFYFIERGWFFSNSAYSEHYSLPGNFTRIIRHFAEFGLRSVENGRIIVWLIGIFITYISIKSKSKLTPITKVLILFFLLQTSLYFLFIFISQMPFSPRYFMPQFFVLTILSMSGIIQYFENRKVTLIFVIVLVFELTGNFWIYPERIAKSWDSTLAHLSYYEVRKECFDYIDLQKLDYKDISAGFCLYGERRFIELKNVNKAVDSDPSRKYFIYSNISNLQDSLADDMKNPKHWAPVKRFEKGFVFITIYRNLSYKQRKEP